MLKSTILCLFILNGGLSLAKPKNSKNKTKNLLVDTIENTEKKEAPTLLESIKNTEKKEAPTLLESINNTEKKEAPTLLESINNTEKKKQIIQRELAKAYNFKLGDSTNKAIEASKNKKAISFGDVDLQISERSEEILEKKEAPNRSLGLFIKSKRKNNSKK